VEDIKPVEAIEDTRTPILWHSNAPWAATGYGTQTGLFGPRVVDLGYRLAFSAFYGLKGSRIGWQDPKGKGFVVYPGGRNNYGNDVIGSHYTHWANSQKGLVVTLTDPWVLTAGIMAQLPVLAWTPVDHEPLMPRTHEWFAASGAIPLAMSHFGKAMLERNGFDPLYCPHAYDPTIFRPLDRKLCRESLGIPEDAFLVGMVAANKGVPSRKCFAEAFAGFAEAKKKCGRQMYLYLHTQLEEPEGENLPALLESLGITPLLSDQYAQSLGTPAASVAVLYNAFDVLLNPSQGEGFGVPLAESQACGTPCIVADFSASREVAPVEAGNWCLDGAPIWTPFNAWQMKPHIEGVTDALIEAFEEPEEDRLARRESVHAWASQEYEIEHVMETYMKPALEDALHRIAWTNQRMARAL
jgi:glycosyltransferase involved in cell wall biosynthesis